MRSQPCRSGKQPRGGSWCADPRKGSFRPPLSPLRSHPTLSFSNFCPFTVMRLRELPNPKIYTRQERYRAQPPRVSEPWGFHSENSLAVYQGLVYYLLWLHSKYDKVGAVRGGSYLRWYRRGFYAGELWRRAEQSRAASVLPRLKGARGGDLARLRRDGFGLGARVGGRAESRGWVCIFQFGSGAGTEAGDTACLDIPTPSPRCLQFLQPYADPAHDPTWRWWKNKKQDQVRGEDGESGDGAEPGSPPHRSPVQALTLPRTPSPRITTSTWPATGGARAVCTLT